ncbi:AsmA-like C-terminal domain-containing protein [Sulfuricurvum sp.]|uniref:YhdP family protein n=1 Tax=Sulfuricurvum sp. TaxID=2025608 RepID=UPI0026228BA9|nr:AsmA-like C-terminal domain-containing protein [Sulfuricurvum sp.]MDD4884292.1 AsmA-like C-terminal domain-containing protein [Sulfuricurvum sp.]
MKETLITKTIPRIHRNLVLFFATVFLLGFFIFLALLEGFQIDHLRFKGVTIEKLYLKWDDSLRIVIGKIDLSDMEKSSEPFTLKPLSKLPPIVRSIEQWVYSIHIQTLRYKTLETSIRYQRGEIGEILLQEGNYTCEGSFRLDPTRFDLTLPPFTVADANLSGSLRVNLPQQKLQGDITLRLPDTPDLKIRFQGDTDTFGFSALAEGTINTIKPLVDFFGIDPEVQPWIVEYAKATSITLNSAHGTFHYDTPEELLTELRIEATVANGEYTFAQGFEPIKAPEVFLSFRRGKLYISPQRGTFYTLPTEKSNLFIDFTTPHTMLEAHIDTDHAMLNDPILSLLRFYKINVPLKQTTGDCAVDLNLSINLHTLDTTAQGNFRPSPSDFTLDKIALHAQGGIVRLDNARVTFDDFIASYGKGLATAKVRGEYNASKDRGIVSIDAYDVSPLGNKNYFSLKSPREPLHVSYIIAPEGDSLDFLPSQWNILGETLQVNGFRAPFDYHNASTAIHNIPFSISNTASGKISALFDGSKQKSDIKIGIQEFHLGEIQLRNAPFNINIRYDGSIARFGTPDASVWSIHKLPLLISPFSAEFDGDEIAFSHIETVLGDLLKGKFSGFYRLDTKKGNIDISNMVALNPKLLPLVDTQDTVTLDADLSGEEIVLNAEALKTRFTTITNGWKMSIGDIRLLSQKSPILRRYDIDNGYLNIFYTGATSRYSFNGEIDYPYALMVINDTPVSHYRYSGTYQDGMSKIRVNDRLVIDRSANTIDVSGKNIGVNIPQLFKFLSAHSSASTESASSPSTDSIPINITISNTYLYLMKERKIIADTMNATLNGSNMDASLQHRDGNAVLKIRKGIFSINGIGFNDVFMEHLFALSDFSGGRFSFEAKGEAESFDGLMRIEKTILKDYKVLNNVLAFINTVPSLATFSLPNYNTKGLPVEEGYAHFVYNKGLLKVDNFLLDSKEIKMVGEGTADMKAENINGTLTLKTDLGSAIGKVPMVGYILFGDDGSVSTTLTLNGKLDDPQVHTAIAKEIVTAPFNILKRTLVYPFLWMLPDEKKK